MWSSVGSVVAERWESGALECRIDEVAGEVPVALVYDGISHAVMLASPTDLEDFALGFSLTEGIVESPREIYDMDIVERAEGIEVQMRIAGKRFEQLKTRRRSLTGRTGCGLCGAESLSQAFRPLQPVISDLRLDPRRLHAVLGQLRDLQCIERVTGATHAAAWLDAEGQLADLREDVGRHNALDKLVGHLAAAGTDFSRGSVLVTSRASHEMVQKTAAMGIGIMAAISAPTDLAIRMADRLNLTLVGFLRRDSHMIYTHPHRLRD